jgi:formylglycine-generating enzyme required for sulfatase activity
LLNLESLIAEVPSVIVPEESNLLINPRHPAHGEVVADIVRPWIYDARLLPAARAGIPTAGPPWREPLGAEVNLEMVPMPGGSFLMGSPGEEPGRLEHEGPQHLVRLEPLSLARTPITQAQWRIVAGWRPPEGDPPWERELNPDPSAFRGDHRPVANVSWFDAQEFCRRLRWRTGKNYALPSESQWEYACRAGTITPYAFGESLSQRQANVCRSETTEVAMFPANGWGLADMHGNVWEWCADHWHENYVGAPVDGGAWLTPNADESEARLLRGGSWLSLPDASRSACRHFFPPGVHFPDVGFRVCALPPGPSS